MKYQIVGDITPLSLTYRVNILMENGWRPIGSMSIEKSRSADANYYQAMILDERSIIKQSGNG